MEVQVLQGMLLYSSSNYLDRLLLTPFQRESSATIKAPPISYNQASPPTRQKVIEFDCRGLEFTEFRPEVSPSSVQGSTKKG